MSEEKNPYEAPKEDTAPAAETDMESAPSALMIFGGIAIGLVLSIVAFVGMTLIRALL